MMSKQAFSNTFVCCLHKTVLIRILMIFIKLMQSLSAVISRVNDLLELTLLLWCLCLQVFGHNGVI